MHEQFLSEPIPRQSKFATSAATVNTDHKQPGEEQVEDEQVEEEIIDEEYSTKKAKATKKIFGHKLIVHYTHEKRLESLKRDMHEVYHDIFKDTSSNQR